MLQNPRKTLGFKKNMVYKIPPGGGGKPYPASGLPVFQTGSLKLKIVRLQSYSSTSKVMRFEKVYFAPLPFSLGHYGCIYDSKSMEFNCHMNN